MKNLYLCVLLVLCGFALVNSITIDSFAENTGLSSSNIFCSCEVTNTTCYRNLNASGANVIGNNRAVFENPYDNTQEIVNWRTGCRGLNNASNPSKYKPSTYCDNGLAVTTGCPSTGCQGQYGQGGQLSYSTPSYSNSSLVLIWNGECPTSQTNFNYQGLGGVDITDSGISDSFNILVGKVDLSNLINIFIWTDSTHGSNATFDPQSYGYSANLNNAYTRVTLPFNTFTTVPGAVGPATFSRVGAIVMQIQTIGSVDLIIALIETAGTLELNKQANITSDSGIQGVAEPGDIITYNLTLSYQGAGLNAATVYLWDDPSVNYLANNNTFPYYSLVPGSLYAQLYQISITDTAITYTPFTSLMNATEINGPNVLANLNRLVLYLGDISSNTLWNVQYSIRIPSTLPCCLPTCKVSCSGTNAPSSESCYCLANTAYFCEANDAINLNQTNPDGSKPNFNTYFVSTNCGPTTRQVRVGNVFVTQSYYTTTPVYAPSSPNTGFSSALISTAVANQVFAVPFYVRNNGTRDTAAAVSLNYPSSLVSPSGSSSPFTCSSGTCTLNSASISSGQTINYSINFAVNPVSGCGSTPATFTVAIAPNGCPSATTGSGTGACVDVNTADNTATSTSVNITGSVTLSMNLNTTSTSITPGGSAQISVCYSNTGLSASPGTTATVTLPTGFTGSSSGSWVCNGNVCTYNIGTIAASTTVCTPLPVLTATWNVVTLNCTNPVLRVSSTISSTCGSTSASITLNPVANTAISLSKTGPSSVVVGSVINYSLTYSNNGTRQYDTVVLTETVPTNTRYSGTGWTCSGNGVAGSTCTVVISPATPNIPVAFQVTVTSNSCSTPNIVNTANAQGTCASNPSFNTSIATATVTTAVTGNPDLYITKRATDGNGNTIGAVTAGNSVTYVITYGNRGNTVTNAVITESAVDSTAFTFTGPNTWTLGANGQRTFAVSNLAPGANGTVNFVVTAASTAATCISPLYPNSVSIATSAPCVENNLADNTANASVSIVTNTDLYVTFTPVSTVTVPSQTPTSLQFCYGNLGNSANNNVTMTVTLPSQLVPSTSGNNGWVINGNVATVSLGTVAAQSGQTCRPLLVTLPTSLNCNDVGFNGTVTISGSCNETNYANNVAPVYVPVTATYDLIVTKTQSSNATFRQSNPVVVYTIGYQNVGGRNVQGVVLTETVPQNTQFVSGQSSSQWTSQGNGVYTINLGTLAAGASASGIAFAVQISLPVPTNVRTIQNCAYINTTVCGVEQTYTNNQQCVNTPVVGNPDVYILKTDFGVVFFGNASSSSNPAPQFAGDVAVYTLSYGNIGDTDANNVTITETVPVNTVFYAPLSSIGWSCANGAAALSTCTLNVGSVTISGGVRSSTFAVRVGTYSPSTYPQAIRCNMPAVQNFVSITVGSDQVDLNQSNNNANDTTPMAGLPNLYITKADDIGSGPARRAGDNIVYTFTYGNLGVREATNVVITDTIPQYAVYNSRSSSLGWVCASGGVAGSNCTYSISSIAPGQNTSSITLAVTVLTGFPSNLQCITNVVSIDNICGESDYSNNQAQVCSPVTGYFDLVLQKHGYCESIVYQMSYSNVGTIGARDVYLKTYVPVDAYFDRNNSNAGWVCNDITPGSECLLMVTNATDSTSFLAPGAGGTVNFAIEPYSTSMSSTFTLDSSVDDNWTGDNLDPTPDNNRVSTTVGFSGCAECNSCCPPVDTCCPDYTDVNFNFAGVLDGVKTCSS